MFGLPILTRSLDAAAQFETPGPSSLPGPSNLPGIDPQLALPTSATGTSQSTIALTAEQWNATQAILLRLETRLNDQSCRSHFCKSLDSCHRDNCPNALKPKAFDAYNGRSHKGL